MKSALTLLVTCLLVLSTGCATDDIDRGEQRSEQTATGNDTADHDLVGSNTGHNTMCTNSSPQPCPCNNDNDCPSGFYCQPADSTPLYGYCWPKPTCNAGDPNCN
jgi:hypothetical protein